MADAERRPLIVCALEYERAMLHKAGLDRHFTIECCGPGPQGVRRWAATVDPQADVILAGLAGALHRQMPLASAWSINAVLANDGQRLIPPLVLNTQATASITSTASIVKTAPARQLLRSATGADLVDLESLAFAQIASAQNWNWAIVRAVSDNLSFQLPTDIDRWIDERGRTRSLAIARSLLRRPATFFALLKLARSSGAAMREVAVALRSWQSAASPVSNR